MATSYTRIMKDGLWDNNGVFTASTFGVTSEVSVEDVELLRAIADQSAVALTNAQLLAESRASAARCRLARIESPTASAPVRIAVAMATPSATPRFVRQ